MEEVYVERSPLIRPDGVLTPYLDKALPCLYNIDINHPPFIYISIPLAKLNME